LNLRTSGPGQSGRWWTSRACTEADAQRLREIVLGHAHQTQSQVGTGLLADWEASMPGRFTEVMPRDYKRVLALAEQAA
jgi:glutamate synthase (NADPH/NADH) large chain